MHAMSFELLPRAQQIFFICQFCSQIYLNINLQQTGFGSKIPKRNACQALVSSFGIICESKRFDHAVLATSEVPSSLARTSRIARGMQENLRRFVVLRPDRAHYRKCTSSRRNCQSRACTTAPRNILPAAR